MMTAPLPLTADRDLFLRRVLLADGLASGSTGLLLALAAGPLADLLGLSTTLLRTTGVILLPFAAFVLWLATRPTISRRLVWALIATNALWTIDSVALLLTGWVDPTTLGVAFVIGQALVVAAFAEMQYLGLRRAS